MSLLDVVGPAALRFEVGPHHDFRQQAHQDADEADQTNIAASTGSGVWISEVPSKNFR